MKASITVKRKKRGRPATGTDPLVGVRFPAPIIEALDARAKAEGATRSDVIRRLVELGLKAKAPKR